MKTPIIVLKRLTKSFDTNIVLSDINLEVNKGEILGIIGASGSGKTTFLNTLIGFVQPDKGDILFSDDGKEFVSIYENHDFIKRKVGFASQTPSFYSKLTVYENLDYFGSLYGLSKEARKQNIETLLELVELSKAKKTLAENLSGGMQRRLDIACSLIHDPSILILDEPTSDLDPVLGKHIWYLVQRINKRGTTIVVASHNFLDIETVCSRIAILTEGKMTNLGTIQELTSTLSKGQEMHIETYPGNYEKISKQLEDSLIIKKENRGNELVIYTTKPDKVLNKLLTILSRQEEHIMDLKIIRRSLGDVFSKVTKK